MPTLTQYRQYAAREMGSFFAGAAAEGSTTSVLTDTAWPIKSSLNQNTLWTDKFLLRPTAAAASDKVRVVKEYDSATGQLTPDTPWTNAPAEGEAYELHGHLEPLTQMTDLINQALKHCMLVVEFSFAPTADAQRHSLAASAPWLIDPRWVRQVGYLAASEDRAEVDPFRRSVRGEAVRDGSAVYLTHRGRTFTTTDTVHVRAIKPAYHHCAAAGTPTVFTQDGLSAEGDVAVPDTEWVAMGVIALAWERLGSAIDPSADQRAQRVQARAAARFDHLTSSFFRLPPLTLRPIQHWGPVR